MPARRIEFDENAGRSLKRGVDIFADAVKTTLGPKGRNVAIGRKWGSPTARYDGATVAKEIELPDPFENVGAQLLKEAATKTNDVAGDGTTTATVLAQAIVHEGLRTMAAGANPMQLKKGIDEASAAVVARIIQLSTPIKGKREIAQIATISAADAEIGNLIAEVMDKVGMDGVITVEESKGLHFETEYVEGMSIDRGYISPYFITNSDRMEVDLDEPYILITDKKISAVADIVPVLERTLQQGKRDLVIIAEDVDGEALATLVVNKLRGTLNVLAIKAPGFGDRRKEMLADVAILTGGKVISEETGRKLDQTQIVDLGRARRVTANKDETIIVEAHGNETEIQSRVKAIKAQVEETTSDYDREKLQERLAKLSGGVAVIKVGAATEVELKEKKHRVEDALSATRAAVEEGVVTGGGVALITAALALDDVKLTGDEGTGVLIVRHALEEPLKMIAENAGQDGSVVLQTVRRLQQEKGNANWGYNVVLNDYVDLVAAGVIDPAKVTRSALENASSIAGMILTTESLLTDTEEHAKKMQPILTPADDTRDLSEQSSKHPSPRTPGLHLPEHGISDTPLITEAVSEAKQNLVVSLLESEDISWSSHICTVPQNVNWSFVAAMDAEEFFQLNITPAKAITFDLPLLELTEAHIDESKVAILGVYPSRAIRSLAAGVSFIGNAIRVTLTNSIELLDPEADNPSDNIGPIDAHVTVIALNIT